MAELDAFDAEYVSPRGEFSARDAAPVGPIPASRAMLIQDEQSGQVASINGDTRASRSKKAAKSKSVQQTNSKSKDDNSTIRKQRLKMQTDDHVDHPSRNSFSHLTPRAEDEALSPRRPWSRTKATRKTDHYHILALQTPDLRKATPGSSHEKV